MPWGRDARLRPVRGAGVAALLSVALLLPSVATAAPVGYRTEFVNGFGCHIVQVNLGSPTVKVTPILSLRFPGGAEPMMELCRRERPVAAVTGTFFSKTTLLPVGDIVIDGRLEYFGGMGSAIALTPGNEVVFERLPYGRRQDWGPFESVLACGPLLLAQGEVALAPRHEHFEDPHVLGRASRTAVGLTPMNKLLMVVTREQISLWELAKIMRSLGCIDAINLDGGSSTGMYYRGSVVVGPARSLVNVLAVYEDVPPETRTCLCELPDERNAIYRYRAARAYEVYLRAQVPLALGDLEAAVR
ncbi:MAG: phosphodiester glycosidase family protein, partial [Armatimonadota bacterium]